MNDTHETNGFRASQAAVLKVAFVYFFSSPPGTVKSLPVKISISFTKTTNMFQKIQIYLYSVSFYQLHINDHTKKCTV